jgi:hypothetical protein
MATWRVHQWVTPLGRAPVFNGTSSADRKGSWQTINIPSLPGKSS